MPAPAPGPSMPAPVPGPSMPAPAPGPSPQSPPGPPGSSYEDIIMAGDIIYLRAHTGNHIDVENGVVASRFNDHGPKQMFRIEKDGGGAIHNSDTIYLRTHEDKHVGVQNEHVSADW